MEGKAYPYGIIKDKEKFVLKVKVYGLCNL